MLYSVLKKQLQTQNRRSFLLLTGKLGFFSLVGWKLFDIQIIQSEKYNTLSKENQINIEILYPIRGEIKDRNDVVIATNIKTYNLYIIPEQCPDIKKTLNEKLSNKEHWLQCVRREIANKLDRDKEFSSFAKKINLETNHFAKKVLGQIIFCYFH